MKFVLTIDCDNAAFGETPHDRAWEVGMIIDRCARYLQDGDQEGDLRDTNGNQVGRFVLTERHVSVVDTNHLETILSAASSYEDDLSSGLEDGMYEEGEDTLEDLELARENLGIL